MKRQQMMITTKGKSVLTIGKAKWGKNENGKLQNQTTDYNMYSYNETLDTTALNSSE